MTILEDGATGASKTPQWIDLSVLTAPPLRPRRIRVELRGCRVCAPGHGRAPCRHRDHSLARRYGFDLLTTAAVAIGAYFLLGTPFTMPISAS